MALNVVQPNVVVLQNTVGRLAITVLDANGDMVDPVSLDFSLCDLGGVVEFSDVWPAPSARIVRVSVGRFCVDIGNQVVNTETDSLYRWVATWKVQISTGSEFEYQIQNVIIISIRTASFLPELKLLIDKSRKSTKTVDGQDCFLGYSDSMLVSFLEGGLQHINAYQPSLTFTLDYFPLEYKQVLIDAALITGVTTQQLYSIDTDIPSYSDQGTAFVISHQPQLAAFLNQISQRLDKLIPAMKLQLIQPGTVHTQMGPNFRLQTLLSAAPAGALFRNIFFRA